MSDNKQVSSLDEGFQKLFNESKLLKPDFKNFNDWWNSLKPQYKTPEIIFKHFETYFKPQWQSQQTKPHVLFEGEMQFLEMVISDNTSTDVEAIKIINAINNYLKCVQQHQPPILLGSEEPSPEDILWAKTKVAEYESQQKETKPTGLSKDEMEVWNEKGGLSKYEWELEKIVDKIRVTGTLESIGILRSLLSNPPTSDEETPIPIQKPTGLRWVKASERLPDKTVYGKAKGLLYNEEIKNALITPMPNGYFSFEGPSFFYTKQSDYIIKWLDESGETEETKPVEDKAKYYSEEEVLKAWKFGQDLFEWWADGRGGNSKFKDYTPPADKKELIDRLTPKPVSEEGGKYRLS